MRLVHFCLPESLCIIRAVNFLHHLQIQCELNIIGNFWNFCFFTHFGVLIRLKVVFIVAFVFKVCIVIECLIILVFKK
jgi:hypothetical protein